MASLGTKLNNLSSFLIREGTPRLKTFWYYARVELTPPSVKDIPEIKNGVAKIIRGYKTGAWKQVPVKQAFLNALITTEVVCWFFVGECIGKHHLIGYKLH